MLGLVKVGRTTVESREAAEQLAECLVQEDLVACAQIDGPLVSVYRWEGRVVKAEEWGLTLKFAANAEDELAERLARLHPYDEPQWVCFEAQASAGYAAWVNGETKAVSDEDEVG